MARYCRCERRRKEGDAGRSDEFVKVGVEVGVEVEGGAGTSLARPYSVDGWVWRVG